MLVLLITHLLSRGCCLQSPASRTFCARVPNPTTGRVLWVIPSSLKGWYLGIFWNQRRANWQASPQQWLRVAPASNPSVGLCGDHAVTRGRCTLCLSSLMGSGRAEQEWPQPKPSLVLWHSSHPFRGQSENPKRQRCVCCTEHWSGLVQVVEKTLQPWETAIFRWTFSRKVQRTLDGNATLHQYWSSAFLSRVGRSIPKSLEPCLGSLSWPTGFKCSVSVQTDFGCPWQQLANS